MSPAGPLLLALDVGNTQTVVGLLDAAGDGAPLQCWRLSTVASRTTDEFRLAIKSIMADAGRSWDETAGIVLSSVVPRVTETMAALGRDKRLLVVGPHLRYDFSLRLPLPAQLGADRLVNAQAAVEAHGAPVIIVDCGTATTFCAINGRREYLGGAIAPGVQISVAALFERAARLGGVELRLPSRVIGDTTETSLCSGVLFGHACFIDGMVQRIRRELDEPGVKVIGTGGYMELLRPALEHVDVIDPDLTLDGLRRIWRNNPPP